MIEFAAYKILENLNDETLSKVELFSTQLYTNLVRVPVRISSRLSQMSKAQQSHMNVERWTKGKNIFGKKIHLYPINEEQTHWYLIMMIFPDMSNGFDPYVAVLDSVGGRKELAVDNLKNYLLEELKTRKTRSVTANDIINMETVYPNIPNQPDGSSCGLYVLHYIQQILTGLEDKSLSSMFNDTTKWFKDDINRKRFEISRIIIDTAKSTPNYEKLVLPEIQFFPTAAEDREAKSKNKKTVECLQETKTMEVNNKFLGKTEQGDNVIESENEIDIMKSYQNYIQHLKQTQKDITLRRVYHVDTSSSKQMRKGDK